MRDIWIFVETHTHTQAVEFCQQIPTGMISYWSSVNRNTSWATVLLYCFLRRATAWGRSWQRWRPSEIFCAGRWTHFRNTLTAAQMLCPRTSCRETKVRTTHTNTHTYTPTDQLFCFSLSSFERWMFEYFIEVNTILRLHHTSFLGLLLIRQKMFK